MVILWARVGLTTPQLKSRQLPAGHLPVPQVPPALVHIRRLALRSLQDDGLWDWPTPTP